MKLSVIIIPLLLFALLILACIKKVKVFDCFTKGASQSIPLIIELFPFFTAILLMTKLFEICGAFSFLLKVLSPLLNAIGIPSELLNIIILKPFSGSGSLAILDETIKQYGTDSYLTKCACVIFGSSETVFFIGATYFSKCKRAKILKATIISLIATNLSAIFTCLICRFI